ncbi:2Fe-2S iron-sulfur cluster-binding protein [Spongiibacter taiwanensis]|uniref:2Fe-2S iron-sulfur cluster-binding protein n=1 Tax=Spongiibacter taiwanensis TaxID=1748242 RepID=UPI0020358074|nr:2Fe-2S iron-sulfur cluster-binding protein [Spongiibacter taiwanensis]USA41578.1 2Fe-2S iron-sulfur cluster-binding protein [Spongiibacter taiwanensis]
MAGHRLQVQQPGLDIIVSPDKSLLQSCTESGMKLSQSCRNGNCLRCEATLVAGQVTLRDGRRLNAPANIPLCISYPASDMVLESLPLSRQGSYWHAQLTSKGDWQLAAGSQPPPQLGQRVAVLQATRVDPSRVDQISGRHVRLAPPVTLTGSGSAFLIALSAPTRGNLALWHKRHLHPQCLWSNLSADTGQLALSLCRRAQWPGQYWLD